MDQNIESKNKSTTPITNPQHMKQEYAMEKRLFLSDTEKTGQPHAKQ